MHHKHNKFVLFNKYIAQPVSPRLHDDFPLSLYFFRLCYDEFFSPTNTNLSSYLYIQHPRATPHSIHTITNSPDCPPFFLLVISLPIHPRHMHPFPTLFHPHLLHPHFPIQKPNDAFVHGMQILRHACRNLDGQSRPSYYREIVPFGLVGVLDRAALVKDLGAADVELLDFDGKGTVSGLGFSDGDVVFGLRSIHVKNMRLPQHIPHNHILGLPLTRTRRRLRTVIIVLHHTLPLRLHNLHRLIRHVKLHNHRPRGSAHGLHGLIRLSHLLIVHLEQHVSQPDPRRVRRAPVDGEGYHRTFSDGLDEGIGRRLVQRRAEFLRGGEDGAEHGRGDARLVVFASDGQAAFVEGDG
mmetsp:Transcript_1577/g.3437  ORF Transcript_1577/g.3437 Transcript_1577/m.3437 type:complete len:353 (+) Transcript_1577:128-1186(+)